MRFSISTAFALLALAAAVAAAPAGSDASPVAQGGKCTHETSCAQGLFCDIPWHLVEGRCAKKKPVGAACTRRNECEKGATCVTGFSEGLCFKDGVGNDVDGVCFKDENCLPNLFCEHEQGKRGKCVNGRIEGEECNSSSQCRVRFYCRRNEDSSKTCVKRVNLGEACSEYGSCAKGLYCERATAKDVGKCAITFKEGDDCTTGKGGCAQRLGCYGADNQLHPPGRPGTCKKLH